MANKGRMTTVIGTPSRWRRGGEAGRHVDAEIHQASWFFIAAVVEGTPMRHVASLNISWVAGCLAGRGLWAIGRQQNRLEPSRQQVRPGEVQ
jgi:hypothetical protein